MSDHFNPYSPPLSEAASAAIVSASDRSWHITSRGWFAIAMLTVSGLVALAHFVVALLEVKIYFDIWDGAEYDEIYAASLTQISNNLDRIAMLTLLPLVASWIVWMHRAHRNLAQLQVGRLRHFSHSAIWTWFIPIFNYWGPYQVMSEIYWKSLPETGALRCNPLGGNLLRIWWGCWILSSLIAMLSNARLNQIESDAVYVGFLLGFGFSQHLRFLAAGLAVSIVGLVDYNQARRRFEVEGQLLRSSAPVPLSAP